MNKKNIDPVDYAVNLETLREMEEMTPMTSGELAHLRKWVHTGHDPKRNPWGYLDEDSWPMNYLLSYRKQCDYCIHIYYHFDEQPPQHPSIRTRPEMPYTHMSYRWISVCEIKSPKSTWATACFSFTFWL